MNMNALIDSFNDVVISRHRTFAAVARAQKQHLAAVRRANGPNSYLTYTCRHADGTSLSEDEWDAYQDALIQTA
jgi:hypothetical protein